MADCKESNEESKEPEPPFATKFDSPAESSDNSANDEVEKLAAEKDLDSSSSSNSTSSNTSGQQNNEKKKSIKGSKVWNNFGSNRSSMSIGSKTSLLRPSQLNAVTSSTASATSMRPATKSVLQPAKFQNPFGQVTKKSEDESSNTDSKDISKDSSKEESEKDKTKEEQKEKELPKFLALSKTPKEAESSGLNSAMAASASTPSFVFGQNLKERVAVAHDADSSDSSEKEETKEESSNDNGSSELMFSNAAAVCRTTTKSGLTLTQAAQEMEEANRANKRKYSEVTLLTGEEDETNVLQINCKLFAFDKATSSWQERGRGSLRLNDKDEESRLVGRAAGTQRLVLNTMVWPGMTAERAGPKSLRLTAMDIQGDIRIFVVQAAQKEVEKLYNLLLQRLRRAQERQPKKLAAEH